MSLYLVFYKVDNSMGYERHDFDDPDSSKAWDMLMNLPAEERNFYEVKIGYDTSGPSLSDFIEDYNNEDYDDGGWWCTYINH